MEKEVAALVGRNDVVARRRKRGHHLAPTVGEFGEAVQEQDTGPAGGFEAGFEHMHGEAIDVVHEPAANAAR